VWGARTLSSDSSWKYINVRRLFIYVEASIDQGTQWVVFEPNDQTLWARVTQTITNFLTTTWQSGALFGSTADQAFFVKCDATTMTQDDLDNGRLVCLIGIAPVKPAEFVIFRIEQYTQPASTSS
jgi:phage tail sheath protein FI